MRGPARASHRNDPGPRGATQAAAFAAIEEKIRANTSAVLDAVRAKRVSPRRAALDLATAAVKRAMSYRRFPIL